MSTFRGSLQSDKIIHYKYGEDALEEVKKELVEADWEKGIVRLFDTLTDKAYFRQQAMKLREMFNNPDKA